MKFQMIQFDIDRASCHAFDCPVAQCIMRIMHKNALVDTRIIRIYPNIQSKIDTPDNVRNFINDYDCKRKVEPIEFELPIEI